MYGLRVSKLKDDRAQDIRVTPNFEFRTPEYAAAGVLGENLVLPGPRTRDLNGFWVVYGLLGCLGLQSLLLRHGRIPPLPEARIAALGCLQEA